MHIRRLVKAGQASHTVSLPKAWLVKNNLKKGDALFISEQSDTELLISPKQTAPNPEERQVTILVDQKDIGTIQREITSAYINNYSVIILLGKGISEYAKQIRDIIHNFVALEIAEQTADKIVAKDLLNLSEISIDKTIRRMDMIVRSIISDSIKNVGKKDLYESISFRDADVNRIYFMLFRLLKSTLNDTKMANHFKISNNDVLSLWYLTLNLENIADCSKSICKLMHDLDQKTNTKELKELYQQIEKTYLEVMKAYFNHDRKLADNIAGRRVAMFDKCSLFFENNKSLSTAQLVENFKELTTQICNIARIVLDKQ